MKTLILVIAVALLSTLTVLYFYKTNLNYIKDLNELNLGLSRYEFNSDISLEALEKELVGRKLTLRSSVWYFSEKDTNKVVKILKAYRWDNGTVTIHADVKCRKSDTVLLSGCIEFNYNNNVLYEIRNVNAIIITEYK